MPTLSFVLNLNLFIIQQEDDSVAIFSGIANAILNLSP
jgi:hypothetical protein